MYRIRSLFPAALLFAALGLFAAACSSQGSAPDTAEANSAGEAAAANEEILEQPDDVRQMEVLDVRTGEISTLAGAVDGDRPVLLWFYAPH